MAKKMRILYAWELGDNFGHLDRGAALAVALRSAGYPVLFSVRNTALANRMFSQSTFPYVQAPIHLRATSFIGYMSNYSDILLASGYDNENDLMGLLSAWISQLRLFGADLIVADHSPTALLAARVLDIPAIALGTGFEIPPNICPYPSFNSSPQGTELGSKSDNLAVGNINAVMMKLGTTKLSSVQEIFTYSTNFLTTFKELDHYAGRDGGLFVGPMSKKMQSKRLRWNSDRTKKVFVYMRGSLDLLGNVLKVVQHTSIEAICVFPGLKDNEGDLPSGIQLENRPVSLEFLLPDCSLVISNGGAGLTAQALRNGVPMVIIPLFDEQRLGAQIVANANAGLIVDPSATRIEIRDAIDRVYKSRRLLHGAKKIADQYRNVPSDFAVKIILEHIGSLDSAL